MTTLIKNGTIYYKDTFRKLDILIEDKVITEVGEKLDADAERVIDAEGKHVFPGFFDLHSHLRDPGQIYKEDIVSGTRAAAKGGFTTVCAMANTEPIVDNIATVEYIKRKANDLGSCKVLVVGALSKKSEGKEIAEIASMLEGGIVAVSDDGGCIQNAKLKLNALKYVSGFGIPVIVHAEDYHLAGKGQINAGRMSTKLGLGGIPGLAEEIMIARDIMFAEKTRCPVHIAHVSTKRSVQLIRQAKAEGISITTEVTPHHLLLNEAACADFNTNTKVKPPLRTEEDRQACIQGLLDGTVDFIATDHAPHADFEKDREFTLAPYGINGFETAFATLYDKLVLPGVIPLEVLVRSMSEKPARFLKIETGRLEEGLPADIAIADLNAEQQITADTMLSKSKNTPFIDQTFKGKIVMTLCEGKITWEAE